MFDPSAVDRLLICYNNLVTDTDMNRSEPNLDESNPSKALYSPNNEGDIRIGDYYMHSKQKFHKINAYQGICSTNHTITGINESK